MTLHFVLSLTKFFLCLLIKKMMKKMIFRLTTAVKSSVINLKLSNESVRSSSLIFKLCIIDHSLPFQHTCHKAALKPKVIQTPFSELVLAFDIYDALCVGSKGLSTAES